MHFGYLIRQLKTHVLQNNFLTLKVLVMIVDALGHFEKG